jgi:tetratricopeptide (TPR) repeat protein
MLRKVLGCLLVLGAGLWVAAASSPLGRAQDTAAPQSEMDKCLQRCREEIQQGRADEAVAWGEKAVALAPASAEAHLQLALAYNVKLDQSSGMGRLSPAKKYKSALEKTVELDPGNLRARNLLFNYLLEAPGIAGGGVDKAKVQAAEIAKLDEKAGYRVRAAVFQKEEKWEQAEKEYKAYLALDPKELNAASLLANFYRNRKNLAGAEGVWTDYLAVQPDNLDALLALGLVRVEMGKHDEAKENFLAGLKAGGGDVRFHYQLGRLSALTGRDPEEGIEHLQAYVQTPPPPGNPTWADAYWRMGNIYEKTGNKDAAVQSYQKALEINPEHKNAKDSLKALGKK